MRLRAARALAWTALMILPVGFGAALSRAPLTGILIAIVSVVLGGASALLILYPPKDGNDPVHPTSTPAAYL